MSLSKEISKEVSDKEYISCGHTACAGCGERLALSFALKGLGQKTIVVVPASCSAVVDGLFPTSATRVPLVHNTFESTAAVACGISRSLRFRQMEDHSVLAFAGDGGTYDIGLQALSAAAERNENILYICYDNEAYMNTGVQRSSATPPSAWTNTTPDRKPKVQPKKNIMEIMAAHAIPYAATTSIAFAGDFITKVQRAKEIRGFKFILAFTPCPTGWRYNPADTIALARLAVESRLFPLYEIRNGREYSLEKNLPQNPLEDYFRLQKRFARMDPAQLSLAEKAIDQNWKALLAKEKYKG